MSSTNWPLVLSPELYLCLSVSLIPPNVGLSLLLFSFYSCFSVPVLSSKFMQLFSSQEICEINRNVGLAHGRSAELIVITFLATELQLRQYIKQALVVLGGGM